MKKPNGMAFKAAEQSNYMQALRNWLHKPQITYGAHEETERNGIQGGETIELHDSAPNLIAQAADYFPPNDIVAATVMADNSTTEIDESDIKAAPLRIAPVEREKIVHAAIHL